MEAEIGEALLQFGTKFAVVIDLAVEDDGVPAGRVAHRLVGAGIEIEDGEASVQKTGGEMGRGQFDVISPGGIRTTMRDPLHHRGEGPALYTEMLIEADDAGQATHVVE